jgi:hypothetical protein
LVAVLIAGVLELILLLLLFRPFSQYYYNDKRYYNRNATVNGNRHKRDGEEIIDANVPIATSQSKRL